MDSKALLPGIERPAGIGPAVASSGRMVAALAVGGVRDPRQTSFCEVAVAKRFCEASLTVNSRAWRNVSAKWPW